MAGHSQFKNIMYRKGAQDKKRAKIFARLIREITVAVQQGGNEADSNPRLRSALAAARAANMPKNNVARALASLRSGGASGPAYEEIRYEGYGPGGVAVIVEAITNNRNRTVSSVRSIFDKHGGSLGESGSVSFLFEQVGEIIFPATLDHDQLLEAVLEAGGRDIQVDERGQVVIAALSDYGRIRAFLEEHLGAAQESRRAFIPLTLMEVSADNLAQILRLLEVLDDDDDVQQLWANFDIPEHILEEYRTSAAR